MPDYPRFCHPFLYTLIHLGHGAKRGSVMKKMEEKITTFSHCIVRNIIMKVTLLTLEALKYFLHKRWILKGFSI